MLLKLFKLIACRRYVWHITFISYLFSIGATLNIHAKDQEDGLGVLHVDANGTEIKVLTYRPPDCDNLSIFISVHGLKRNAKGARNRAIKFAQKTCMMVFAPYFDKDRFPNWRFHRAGVVRKGIVQDRSLWTAPILHKLIEAARREVGSAEAKVYLFGHSAGAQFLSRIAAYTPLTDVTRIVIANPSLYVAPVLETDAPYGFGGVFSEFEANATLKSYLASPITIYLGLEDTGTKYLVTSKAAMRQGKNRLERGRNIFRLAQEAARQRGWQFNWKLVEVAGVGHSSKKLLRVPELYQALNLDKGERVPIPPPAAIGG